MRVHREYEETEAGEFYSRVVKEWSLCHHQSPRQMHKYLPDLSAPKVVYFPPSRQSDSFKKQVRTHPLSLKVAGRSIA